MFLVVIVDALDRFDTGIFLGSEIALVRILVPIEDTANKGRDQESASLGRSDGLDEREHEGQVAVDSVLGLEDMSSLDAFPCGGDLNENSVLGDTDRFVKLVEKIPLAPFKKLSVCAKEKRREGIYFDDV